MGFQYPFNSDLDLQLTEFERGIPKMILFSGKGGVGKTTSCAALAITRAKRGKRVLIASIDPAHSLGDSFGVDLSDNEIHEIKSIPGLFAIEIDVSGQKIRKDLKRDANIESKNADGKMDEHLDDPVVYSSLMREILLPVSEEINVLNGVIFILEKAVYGSLKVDEIYLDGSPSGHMLRVLAYPFLMRDFYVRLLNFYGKIRSLFELNLKKRKLNAKKEILKKKISQILDLMRNEAIFSLVLVTIPETMSFVETKRTYNNLRCLGIPVKNLIINRVNNGNSLRELNCKFCSMRVKNESEVIQKIKSCFQGINIIEVPLMPREIRGLGKLNELARYF
ncbi:MAG: ArsA family ATPase [Promethearchaeota archaeon]